MIIVRRLYLRHFFSLQNTRPWPSSRSITNVVTEQSTISPLILERARSIAAEHTKLTSQLANFYESRLSRKAGELNATVVALQKWDFASNVSLTELQQLLDDPDSDAELRSIATDEIERATEDLKLSATQLKRSIVPVHPFAHLPCLIELRPGAGGSEAGLFAGDLFRMYQAFCKRHRLHSSILKLEDSEGMGNENQIQEVVLEIEGEGAYGILRCEAGVHRVQRVPATETKGRTHTSAVSVLVLPNFPSTGSDELGEDSFNDPASDYYIEPKDVRTDVMRARGAGGQHVNTTDSAIRLTHLPTMTVVSMQDSRSQHKNREKAWQLLRAKIAQARREMREEEMAQMRVNVVGIARMGRGDKIRTYNWGQQRVTDHRSGITLHHLDNILEGGESLDQIMESVRLWLSERELEALGIDEAANKVSKGPMTE